MEVDSLGVEMDNLGVEVNLISLHVTSYINLDLASLFWTSALLNNKHSIF